MDGHLSRTPLFQMLPAATLKRLGGVCELRRFRKGERLFEEGQSAESVWVIRHGWVYLVKQTPHGSPATIFTVTPEEVLCGVSAAVGHGAYYASGIAATATTAIRVPHAEFARLLRAHPGFALAVLAIYHARMRHMAEAISLASSPANQRLAYTLLRLRSSFGKTVPVTHQELARMAGIRWETSIRTLSTMKQHGWLSSSRGKVTILAPEKLRALVRSNFASQNSCDGA